MRDAAHIYEIKAKIGATKQGIFSVTKYNNIMKSLWSKLDYYQNIKIKCNKDVAMMFKVLGKEDLPSQKKDFSIIRVGMLCLTLQ